VLRLRKARISTFIALTVAVLASCNTPAESDDRDVALAESDVSPQQAAAVEDGEVTPDEYAAGFRRYVACMDEAGYTVVGGEVVAGAMSYSFPDAGTEADGRCYATEFGAMDAIYQEVHFAESGTYRELADCLARHGVDAPDTAGEIDSAMAENGIEPQNCSSGD